MSFEAIILPFFCRMEIEGKSTFFRQRWKVDFPTSFQTKVYGLDKHTKVIQILYFIFYMFIDFLRVVNDFHMPSLIQSTVKESGFITLNEFWELCKTKFLKLHREVLVHPPHLWYSNSVLQEAMWRLRLKYRPNSKTLR